jgi:phosphatidylserine decarboxylase
MRGEGVVSPADGRVMIVDEVEDADLGRSLRVAVFMHVYNVHVNRAPVAGVVAAATHKPGGHIPAWNKESERNERFTLVYDGPLRAKTVQIAGTVARRIVPYVNVGDRLGKGQRVGLIRFGSRVDTLVPARTGLRAAVRPGDRVQAGVSTLFHESA